MVDHYRRMGNMEKHLGMINATTAASLLREPRDVWDSPRGTVLRIEALVVVTTIIIFLDVVIGSCRRWSNGWIVQKGFLATHGLSLLLGPYIIGLMQSSSIRSEMYPIWAVSLYVLFGCVDPVTTYSGLDYKGLLTKMVYQIVFHCGYVLLMAISTMSSDFGKIAIGMLSAITLIKGVHTSLALVQQKRMRDMVGKIRVAVSECKLLNKDPPSSKDMEDMDVHVPLGSGWSESDEASMDDIYKVCKQSNNVAQPSCKYCYDACVAFCLSHKLHRHFLGLNNFILRANDGGINFKWAWKITELELAFLYDIFFTGNSYIHYYQAKTASFWALASITGMCFVGVAASIPRARRSSVAVGGGFTIVVDTTTVDLVITLVILVSVALLQLLQLIRCWTCNWARVAFACEIGMYQREKRGNGQPISWSWWMKLRGFVVTSSSWFDKYLWQDKLGQYSLVAKEASRRDHHHNRVCLDRRCGSMLGLDYIWEVLWDLLGSDHKGGAAVRLDNDVILKASIADFLRQVYEGPSEEQRNHWTRFLDSTTGLELMVSDIKEMMSISDDCCYISSVMTWHIVTCYCELAEQSQEMQKQDASSKSEEQHVAITLSKYCAYLVVSAPGLLPGSAAETKVIYDSYASAVRVNRSLFDAQGLKENNREPMGFFGGGPLKRGVDVARWLLDEASPHHCDRWKVLADGWVRLLVCCAMENGNVDEHMRRLSQGGEFITHLWALLHHMDVRTRLAARR